MRTRFYDSLNALQEDLDEWMDFYNNERPNPWPGKLGYINQGKRPIDMVMDFGKSVREEG